MKNNVDLTIKRDFKSKPKIDIDELMIKHLSLHFNVSYKLPWAKSNLRIINNDNDLIVKDSEVNYDNIIITGNKDKRKETKFYRHINKNVCDCCGKLLDYIPWKRSYGLCKNCDTFDKHVDRNPWKKSKNIKRVCWR